MTTIATEHTYTQDANNLADRIAILIPEHPEILEFQSPFQMFTVEGFKLDGLAPTLAQAAWALERAKRDYRISSEIMAKKT